MANYSIEHIEGIGPAYAAKLRQAGIKTVYGLLEKSCIRKGRRELSAVTRIDESMILKWTNMADLYRVRGIGSEYAELLEKAGVDTVKELRNRNPEQLAAKIAEVNSRGRGLVRQLPGSKRVKSWVEHARKLKPMVSY